MGMGLRYGAPPASGRAAASPTSIFGGKASRVGGGPTRNSHISSHESNVCVYLRPAITTGCFGSDAVGPGNFPRVNAMRGVTCQGQRSWSVKAMRRWRSEGARVGD